MLACGEGCIEAAICKFRLEKFIAPAVLELLDSVSEPLSRNFQYSNNEYSKNLVIIQTQGSLLRSSFEAFNMVSDYVEYDMFDMGKPPSRVWGCCTATEVVHTFINPGIIRLLEGLSTMHKASLAVGLKSFEIGVGMLDNIQETLDKTPHPGKGVGEHDYLRAEMQVVGDYITAALAEFTVVSE